MRNFFALGEISVRLHKDVVQQTGKLPVIGRVRDALHLLADDSFFPFRDARHHIGEVRGTEQEKMFHAFVMVTGKKESSLTGARMRGAAPCRSSRKNS